MVDFLGVQMGLMNALRTGHPGLDIMVCLVVPLLIAWVTKHWRNVWEYCQTHLTAWTGSRKWNKITLKDIEIYSNGYYASPRTRENSHELVHTVICHMDKSVKRGSASSEFPQCAVVCDEKNWVLSPQNERWAKFHDTELQFRMRSIVDHSKTMKEQTTTLEIRSKTLSPSEILDWVKKLHRIKLEEDKIKEQTSVLYTCVFRKLHSSTIRVVAEPLLNQTFNEVFFPGKDRLMARLDAFENNPKETQLGILLSGPPGTGKTSAIRAIANHLRRHCINMNLIHFDTDAAFQDAMHGREFDLFNLGISRSWARNRLIHVFEDIDAGCSAVLCRPGMSVKGNWAFLKRLGLPVPVMHDFDDVIQSLPVCVHARSGSKMVLEYAKIVVYLINGEKDEPFICRNLCHNYQETFKALFSPLSDSMSHPFLVFVGLLLGLKKNETFKSQTCDQCSSIVSTFLGLKIFTPFVPWCLSHTTCMTVSFADFPSAYEISESEVLMVKFDEERCLQELNHAPKHTSIPDTGLTLSGILNVLDGAMRAKDGVFIMTSNRSQVLDPALVRPGRVDFHLVLDALDLDSCLGIAHVWLPPDPDSVPALQHVLSRRSVTGSQMEQACRSCSSLAEAVDYLCHET